MLILDILLTKFLLACLKQSVYQPVFSCPSHKIRTDQIYDICLYKLAIVVSFINNKPKITFLGSSYKQANIF